MYKIIENHPNDSRVKYKEDGVFQTLSSRMGTGGGNVPMIHTIAGNIINRADKNGGHQMGVGEDVSFTLNTVDRHAVAITGGTFFQCTDDDTSPTLKARDYKEPIAVCPIPQKTVRRLTPIECERLQGWPDNYTNVPLNGKPASDSARYKALGNGMAQPCARWIIQRIVDVTGGENDGD